MPATFRANAPTLMLAVFLSACGGATPDGSGADASAPGTGSDAGLSLDASAGPVPQTTLHTFPPALTNSTTATFDFTASEDGCTFVCTLEDATPFDCAPPFEATDLLEGTHYFSVRAVGPGGEDDSPAEHTWEVDYTAPHATIALGPPAVTSSPNAQFAITSNDPSATLTCQLDARPSLPCSSSLTLGDLPEGPHALRVVATDRAGNADPAPQTWYWTIDLTAGDTSITSGPPLVTASDEAVFVFSAGMQVSGYQCSLDGSEWPSPASPAT